MADAQGTSSDYGITVNATGTTVLGGAHGISVYNTGSNAIFVLADGDLSDLTAAVTAGTGCIRIAAGASYAFPTFPYQAYSRVHLACASGETSTADVAIV